MVMKDLGESVTEEDLDTTMKEADMAGNGVISHEFLLMFQSSSGKYREKQPKNGNPGLYLFSPSFSPPSSHDSYRGTAVPTPPTMANPYGFLAHPSKANVVAEGKASPAIKSSPPAPSALNLSKSMI